MVVAGEVGWFDMDSKRKFVGSLIRKNDIPHDPGIYAWYRDGKRMYLGKAANLQNRLWNNHLGCLDHSRV